MHGSMREDEAGDGTQYSFASPKITSPERRDFRLQCGSYFFVSSS